VADPGQRLSPIVRVAPAKLNLTLAVVGHRPDGYHAIHSVVVLLDLADRLSLAVRPSGEDSLHVDGFDCGPAADNLVIRALALAREHARHAWPGGPADPPPLAVRLEKHVPVAAGLGGGSSDAAAAIDAAFEAWQAPVDRQARTAVAAAVGSDVPLFLAGGPVLIEGRGERVTPLHGVRCEPGEEPAVVLITPAVPAHTTEVFAAWSGGAMADPGIARRTSEHFASEFGSGLTPQRLLERAAVLASANDLAPAAAAVIPALVPFRRALTRQLARPIGLSGSGPTLWALYPSREEARAAAEAVGRAVADGTIVAPGDEPPFVTAATIGRRVEEHPSPPDRSEP
jgi:4-diphosphocytidyl-2-C-methyl-D-erythritol kinase